MHGDDDFRIGLLALSRHCRCSVELLVALVDEGAIEAQRAPTPEQWQFDADALRRARRAVRLARDLELNPPGVALALELLDEIARLERALAARG